MTLKPVEIVAITAMGLTFITMNIATTPVNCIAFVATVVLFGVTQVLEYDRAKDIERVETEVKAVKDKVNAIVMARGRM